MPHTIVAIFRSLPDAHSAQISLDAEKIESEIGGTGLAPADPFAPLRPASIQLLVPREDAARATEVLAAAGYRAAVDRLESLKSDPTDPTWPRLFQIGGLIVALAAVVLMLTTDHPDAFTLLGLGVLLWGIGLLGRPRRKTEA